MDIESVPIEIEYMGFENPILRSSGESELVFIEEGLGFPLTEPPMQNIQRHQCLCVAGIAQSDLDLANDIAWF